MFSRRSTLSLLAPLTGAVACLALVASPTLAASDGQSSRQAQTSQSGSTGASVPASTARSAANYWTKERMLSAKPAPVPKLSAKQNAALRSSAQPQGSAGKVAGASPKARKALDRQLFARRYGSTAATWPGSSTSAPGMTSGKVFFVGTDGRNYVCSGSTINSARKTLVLTAGHCVSDGAGRWYNSRPWIFVPGYRNGNAPYGQWTARQLWTRTAWLNNRNRAEDIGAALMHLQNGQRIVNRVGGQGYEWNYPLSQYQYQFGYPSRWPFNGELLTYCTGQSYNDWGHNGINCTMTEGASGGPWIDDFNGSYGRVDSVNSWVFWNAAGTRYKWNGPYFGNNARDFYNTVTAAEQP